MHAAADVCVYCAESTNDGKKDVLTCYGLCGKSFHVLCLATENSNYKPSLVNNYLKKIDNLHWYCHTCTTFSAKGIAAALIESVKLLCDIKSTLQPQLDQIKNLNAANSAKKSIDSQTAVQATENGEGTATHNIEPQQQTKNTDDIITIEEEDMEVSSNSSINSQINGIANGVNSHADDNSSNDNGAAESNATAAQIQKRRKIIKTRAIKRPAASLKPDKEPIIYNAARKTQPKPVQNVQLTTGNSYISQISNTKAPNNPFKSRLYRYLYISQFDPSTHPMEIIDHLKERSNTSNFADQINCYKLKPRKRSVNSITFVSFKLEIPRQYFDIVADPAVWPEELTINEFEERPSPQPTNSTLSTKVVKITGNKMYANNDNGSNVHLNVTNGQRNGCDYVDVSNSNKVNGHPNRILAKGNQYAASKNQVIHSKKNRMKSPLPHNFSDCHSPHQHRLCVNEIPTDRREISRTRGHQRPYQHQTYVNSNHPRNLCNCNKNNHTKTQPVYRNRYVH